jgi:hypothetical protein
MDHVVFIGVDHWNRIRNKNDSYACRDLDLWFATASRKSQIQYLYFHVYWEIANFVICYGFLTLRGKICNGLSQICDLCLWITNTNEIWECSNSLSGSKAKILISRDPIVNWGQTYSRLPSPTREGRKFPSFPSHCLNYSKWASSCFKGLSAPMKLLM